MNLKEHYDQLYSTAVAQFASDNYEIDDLINSKDDDRYGLSLIFRPNNAVNANIQAFLNQLKGFEPHQYYYPDSDIHVTVISIISCYSGLQLSQLNIPEYVHVAKECLKNIPPINISFKGITASPCCLMIQGFMNDNQLPILRDRLRTAFTNSGLQESMDERYLIQTAHATVFRFTEPLRHKDHFLSIIEQYRGYDFGTIEVNEIELVFNDWFHQEDRVTKLYRFNLGTPT